MDGIQFDTVAKMFATTPLTRGRALRSMAAGVAALVGVRLSAEPGTAKKKEKKIQLCVCASADVTTCQNKNKPKSKAKKILQNKPCSYTGRCRLGVSGCIGCAPANNTQQGTCLAGQICNAGATCVAGCTGTTNPQGSCPSGQNCVIVSGQTTGQCQNAVLGCTGVGTQGSCLSGQICVSSICIPAGCLNPANTQCSSNQVCCPVGSASGGQCRGTLQAC
jgi:hypothetical protein